MTDQEHAGAIRAAVEELNQRIATAAAKGIEVEIVVHRREMFACAPEPVIDAVIRKLIPN